MNFEAIECLFEWDEKDQRWERRHTVLLNDDDRPIGKPLYTAESWTHQCDSTGNARCIPGRLVTRWTMARGVSLSAFHPPGCVPVWLNPMIGYTLSDNREWTSLIAGAWAIREATANEAKRIIEEAK